MIVSQVAVWKVKPFSHSVTWRPTHLFILPLNGTFTHTWLSNILHYLEDSLLRYGDLSNYGTFFHYINWKKITVANIVTDLIRKIFNLGEAHSGRYKVLKILIFAWKLKFDPWKQMLSVVLSEESHIVHAQGIVHAQENVCQTSMSE